MGDATVTPQVFAGLNAHTYNLVPTTILFAPSPAYFVTAKGSNAPLLAHIDTCLSKWKTAEINSPYYDAVDQWLGVPRSRSSRIPPALWVTLAAAALAALALFGLNRILQRQVSRRTQELVDQQQRLTIATQAGHIGVWEFDLNTDELHWDDRMMDLYGLHSSKRKNVYETWKNAVHPDDLEQADQAVKNAIQTRQLFNTTFRIVRPDGDVWHIRTFGQVVCDTQGTPDRMIGTNQDITRIRKNEQLLAEREARFRSLFENAAVGIAEVAPDGRWIRVNQTLCSMVGYTKEELLQRSFQDITYPDDLDDDLACIEEMLTGKRTNYSMEKRYIRKDGTITWIELTVSMIRHPDGTPDFFISIIADINSRKQAERERNESRAILQVAMDQSQAGIAIADAPDGKLRYVNQAGLMIRGKAERDIVRDIGIERYVDSWQILHPSDHTP